MTFFEIKKMHENVFPVFCATWVISDTFPAVCKPVQEVNFTLNVLATNFEANLIFFYQIISAFLVYILP